MASHEATANALADADRQAIYGAVVEGKRPSMGDDFVIWDTASLKRFRWSLFRMVKYLPETYHYAFFNLVADPPRSADLCGFSSLGYVIANEDSMRTRWRRHGRRAGYIELSPIGYDNKKRVAVVAVLHRGPKRVLASGGGDIILLEYLNGGWSVDRTLKYNIIN